VGGAAQGLGYVGDSVECPEATAITPAGHRAM
jgi:hypothetical protein